LSTAPIREVKEETGLDISGLESCGVVHWCDLETDARYLVCLYKTRCYSGELVTESREGNHFWYGVEKLLAVPREKFSNDSISYCHLFFGKEYDEAFVPWKQEWLENGKKLETIYKGKEAGFDQHRMDTGLK
jgi:8-oxo-dGTP diphosphatase